MKLSVHCNIAGLLGLVAVISGLVCCATQPVDLPKDKLTRNANVDQRMLAPEDDHGGTAKVERYELAPSEVFRMPQAENAGNPELPADSPRQTLAPTTVCARVILDAQGSVQRVEPLTDRDDCVAGADSSNGDLVLAMLGKVQQWRFQPAAVCHFAADKPPVDKESCAGAQSVEPVPVTLLYAFTFEVKQGHVQVRSGDMRPR